VSAPCILAPFLLYFLPESVRWQVAKGRIIQARTIMSEKHYFYNNQFIFWLLMIVVRV
jgi:hypothetical protein